MTCSNTAVPKYYGQFRDEVLRGEIPVCKEISLEMNRIDALIRDPRYYYDPAPVEGWIKFCEGELVLTDGSDLTLLPSFKLWGESVFGWYYFVEMRVWVPNSTNTVSGHYETKRIKKRLIHTQYLIVGRGAAKSMYDASILAYIQNVNTMTTHMIVTAPTMKQAEGTTDPIATAITRARGPLFKFLTEGSLQNTTGSAANRKKLASTKEGIKNFLTNSLIQIIPLSIDKLQGWRSRANVVDEWLSCDIRESPITALEGGSSKNDDAWGWLTIATSSEGTIRNGIGDTIKMELQDILNGVYENPHVSIWWYKLDDVNEINNPDMWVKAQPNIGRTVSYETYQLDVERAEKVPSVRNEILAKRFNLPMEGYTYFFTYEETLPHPKQDYWGMPCSMGADLSQGNDFCAFTFLFPLDGETFGVKTRNYITERTFQQLPQAMASKYQEFIDEGSLIVFDGVLLEMDAVYNDLDEYIIKAGYDVRSFGFDPYNAREFVEQWSSENGEYGVEKVIQGAKTESVPLGEIKALAEKRLLLFDEKIMQYAMGNCVVLQDTNFNMKLSKKRYEAKIDAVSALLDAFVAYKRHRDEFM